MGDRGKGLAARAVVGAAMMVLSGLAVSGCGGDADARWSQEPQGEALLPDFAPEPPDDLHTQEVGDSWAIVFSSALVNVGAGDFHATAERHLGDRWTITQDIEHSEAGSAHVASKAQMVWGGDGHEHWHVQRYVTYHLYALDSDGRPTGQPRTDHKIGFCIYDFKRSGLEMGPDDAVYERKGCGSEGSNQLLMGLSPGWVDYYHWDLPGQSIPLDGLADGSYRLFAVADEQGVFEEETRENNRTWVDFTLGSDGDVRTASLTGSGPSPE